MRATSIGHAGILIETRYGSILCDPWFVPAFFGSWFVFPRNDRLPDDLRARIEHPDYLYVSHLHGDHLDEAFLAVHVEPSVTDGPGGDSALVVADGTARLVNQNDCRLHDPGALSRHGLVDMQWLQYSGAIWYPMVYELPDDERRELAAAKVESQFARAIRYVEAVGARAVVPSAGPPCFLDPELAGLNVVTGDEISIFPDATAFLERLVKEDIETGVLVIPGTTLSLGG